MKLNVVSLKKELESSFGRRIKSSRDCIQMVEDIYHKTGETVNSNTLRRFFGLVKAEYPASTSTLTILSKYCGFNSIDEIEQLSVVENGETTINREEIVRYMVSLFKSTEIGNNQEKVFYPIVEQTIVFLERNPAIIDKFQREIARTTTGQTYYYEKLVNVDRLNGYYGDGLRHYLRCNNTDEGKIFAHSIQVFRHWLTKNNELLAKHLSELSTVSIASNYPQHILGRLIAAKLYFANVEGDSIDKILAEAKKYHGAIKAKREDSPFAFPDFELIICESLLLTGNLEEGNEYIWHGKSYLSASGQDKNSLFNLWEDFANSRKASPKKKKKSNPNRQVFYYSFAKKYSTIVKLLSENNRKSTRNQQLSELVKDTGYKRLLSLPV
jgi:hypothetical protein